MVWWVLVVVGGGKWLLCGRCSSWMLGASWCGCWVGVCWLAAVQPAAGKAGRADAVFCQPFHPPTIVQPCLTAQHTSHPLTLLQELRHKTTAALVQAEGLDVTGTITGTAAGTAPGTAGGTGAADEGIGGGAVAFGSGGMGEPAAATEKVPAEGLEGEEARGRAAAVPFAVPSPVTTTRRVSPSGAAVSLVALLVVPHLQLQTSVARLHSIQINDKLVRASTGICETANLAVVLVPVPLLCACGFNPVLAQAVLLPCLFVCLFVCVLLVLQRRPSSPSSVPLEPMPADISGREVGGWQWWVLLGVAGGVGGWCWPPGAGAGAGW